jgi:hypothetical protein
MFERLNEKEFGGALVSYIAVGECFSSSQWDAGVLSKVFLVEASGEPKVAGAWYGIGRLPEPMIAVHRDKIIPIAADAFRAREEGGK